MQRSRLYMLLVTLLLSGCGVASSSEAPDSSTHFSEQQSSYDSETPSETPSEQTSDNLSVETSEKPLLNSTLRYNNLPAGIEEYTHSELFVGNTKIPLLKTKINYSQRWDGLAPNRPDSALAIVELQGRATFHLRTENYTINEKSVIRPLSAGVNVTIDEDSKGFTFLIDTPGNYVIEPNGIRMVAIHLFVRPLSDDSLYKNKPNVIYFGPGLHDRSNNPLLANNSTIDLQSNQTVYLAHGAIVRGRFHAAQKSNIKIIGNGIIDGSTFERIAGQASGNTAFIPLDFNWCSNLYFENFVVNDPAGWTVNWYFVTNSKIDNIGIITSRSNGDGISLQSCQSIEVTRAFVRGWDDTLVVKNYPNWHDRNIEGTTRDILFEDCILWVDLAQAMEIGYETVGSVMENITFRNITVLHALHKPVISIHNANNANIKNVLFENITVENAEMGKGDAGENRQLIDIVNIFSNNWSTNHKTTSMGTIDGVLVNNVLVLNGRNEIPIRIAGAYDLRQDYLSEHWVINITLKDIDIKGEVITSTYPHLHIGEYTKNIEVNVSGNPIIGATYKREIPEEIASEYREFADVYANLE